MRTDILLSNFRLYLERILLTIRFHKSLLFMQNKFRIVFVSSIVL